MSTDKKPFAYLHPDEDRPGRVSLYVGPIFIEDHNGPSDDGWGVEEVERINAAVEARERNWHVLFGTVARSSLCWQHGGDAVRDMPEELR